MTALHIIQTPMNQQDFEVQLKRYYTKGDSIVFLNDAVFSLTTLCQLKNLFESEKSPIRFFALDEQVIARGLNDLLDSKKVTLINYQDFVEITCKADKIISW